MPKVSVIIPVYNVDNYLAQCVDSVINQTYTDVEIILIDDGSVDKSPQLCDEYAARDKRVHVIHQQNSGLGAARNAGLSVATGQYIYFLDSDDWIDADCLADALESAEKNDSDLVLMGETLYMDDTNTFEPGWRDFSDEKTTTISAKNFIKYFTPAWGRLYKRAFIDDYGLRFVDKCFYEDNSWGVMCMCFARKVSFAKNHYFYRQRLSSITGKKDYKIIDWCYDFKYLINFLRHNNLEGAARHLLICGYMWYVINFFNYSRYIANLSLADGDMFLQLMRDCMLYMNLSKQDFIKCSIDHNQAMELWRFYDNMCKGIFITNVTKFKLFGLVPIIKHKIVHKLVTHNRVVHFIHRIDDTNTGDMMSCPWQYFNDLSIKSIVMHDIYTVNLNKIKRNDIVIFGGGGLFDCLDEWNKTINNVLEKCDNCFAWGVGFNTHENTSMKTKINFNKFKKIFIRDKNHPSGFDFCPCPSCMLDFPQIKPCRKIGILEHKTFKLDLDYDRIDNCTDLGALLQFIAESEIIVTSSYHGWYWSTLMGKKVILMRPFSSKFNWLPWPPVFYSGDLDNDIRHARSYPDALAVARNKTQEVFQYIKSMI